MPLCPPDPRRCPRLSYACETNGACRAFGRIGVEPTAVTRRRVALGFAGLGVVALALNIYAACALSSVDSVIKNTAWAVGRIRGPVHGHIGTGRHAYFGLSAVVAFRHTGPGATSSAEEVKWSHIDCEEFTVPRDDDADLERRSSDVSRCKRCKRRVRGMATTVIVSAVTTLGTIRFSLRRATVEGDARFWKFLGIAVGCISFGTAIGPLLAFRQHCTRSATEGIHMRNGPGFICLSIAVCLKGLSVLMHLWLRVPDVSDDGDKAPRDDEEGPEESKDGGGEGSK